jgi:tetratricopeptide (TPR) repeat protein
VGARHTPPDSPPAGRRRRARRARRGARPRGGGSKFPARVHRGSVLAPGRIAVRGPWRILGPARARRRRAAAGLALAAVHLRPLLASYRVAAEPDFLDQAAARSAADLERDRAARSSDPAYFLALGDAYAKERNFPRAIAAYEAALRLDPDRPGTLLNLGNCRFMLSQFDAAAAAYRSILARHPDHADARFNLAWTYYHQHRIKDALREVNELLRRHPSHPKALQLRQQLAP